MKHSVILSLLAAAVLAGGASAALGQTVASQQSGNAHLTVYLSEPAGKQSTLVYTGGSGWRMHAGWDAARPMDAAVPADQRPLTVFIDGPTGHAFVYVVDAGWKFVGRVAGPGL